MADDKWVTVKGRHILIHKADSVADRNEYIKQKQIAENKAEAEERNPKKLPRRLFLPDIPASEANKSSDVLNLNTKQRYKFKDGTYIKKVHVFAGNGCSKEFRDAYKYAKRYPNSGKNASDWQHCSGIAQITNGIKTLQREVHWVQGKDKKIREAFIKFHNYLV